MDGLAELPSDIHAGAQRLGTRFLVYPQPPFIPGYERPELIWLPNPQGTIAPGPSDQRIYVVDPLAPKAPYEFPFLPPFGLNTHPPAAPGSDGSFDHLVPGTREFLSAHVFACVSRVLHICENYLGREIRWFFSPAYDRLEIIPWIPWSNNAQSGFGFLEMGEDTTRGAAFPLGLNFDAIAHETGHLVLLSTVGAPTESALTPEYLAYHEASADFISLLGLLHFDSAVDKILRRTRGNLLVMNELDRFAELADEKQIRVLNHALKMRDVGREVHDLSRPLAGAFFDSLVELFHSLLVERGLSDLDTREIADIRTGLTAAQLESALSGSSDNYERHHLAFKAALVEARDAMGETLARSWTMLDPDGMQFADVAAALITAAEERRFDRLAEIMEINLAWRGLV